MLDSAFGRCGKKDGGAIGLYALQEEEANTLGGALLVPREALLQQIEQGGNDDVVADYFGVSVALVRQRKNTTGIGFQLARRGTWRP
jgi:hypothetical protein